MMGNALQAEIRNALAHGIGLTPILSTITTDTTTILIPAVPGFKPRIHGIWAAVSSTSGGTLTFEDSGTAGATRVVYRFPSGAALMMPPFVPNKPGVFNAGNVFRVVSVLGTGTANVTVQYDYEVAVA